MKSKLSKKYGPMDHDVTAAVLKQLGPGMAVCGQLVSGDNKFAGYVALFLAAGLEPESTNWMEVARSKSRRGIIRKLNAIRKGILKDESAQAQTRGDDPKPR